MNTEPRDGRIVVGVDGSAASLAALRWASWEAGLRGIPLQVVHAWEARRRAPYATPVGGQGWQEDRVDVEARLESAASGALGAPPGVPVSVEVADGLPARVLLERASGADLLVLGTAAHAAHDTLGPVAQACLRRAPCPVVVVSQQQAAHPAESTGAQRAPAPA